MNASFILFSRVYMLLLNHVATKTTIPIENQNRQGTQNSTYIHMHTFQSWLSLQQLNSLLYVRIREPSIGRYNTWIKDLFGSTPVFKNQFLSLVSKNWFMKKHYVVVFRTQFLIGMKTVENDRQKAKPFSLSHFFLKMITASIFR